jgi:hypothetical protein
MVQRIKFCKNCAKAFVRDSSVCPCCGGNLFTSQLTETYWDTLTDEEKQDYYTQFAEMAPTLTKEPSTATTSRIINATARAIRMLGWILLCVGTIASIAWSMDTGRYYTEFSFSTFLGFEFQYILYSMVLVGFGELIQLVNDIKEQIANTSDTQN